MWNPSDWALLVLRLSTGFVMLYAAWKNTQNEQAWEWTKDETALLFKRLPPDRQARLARVCALIGMVMMYCGSTMMVLGIEPRLGGLLVAVFCVLGMRIHAIRRDEALAAAKGGTAIAWSAYSAHIAAGLKNISIAGVGLAIAIAGVGKIGCRVDWIGRLLGLPV